MHFDHSITKKKKVEKGRTKREADQYLMNINAKLLQKKLEN